MSIIIAIDSRDVFSVALLRRKKTTHRVGTDAPHSEEALPLLLQLLADENLSIEDCDAIAFGAGPGRFSALRLVCAIAKTLAYAKNKPLIAVSSMAALAAQNAPAEVGEIKCAIPAHRDHIYFATCYREQALWRTKTVRVVEAASSVPSRQIKHACGDGFVLYPQLLGGANLHQSAEHPNAVAVAHLAAELFALGETVSPLECEPLYVRQRVALTITERQKLKESKG